jgi:hypothetical protein
MWNSCNILSEYNLIDFFLFWINIIFLLLSLELTTACKRINKDGCYEFVTAKSKEKKSVLVEINCLS